MAFMTGAGIISGHFVQESIVFTGCVHARNGVREMTSSLLSCDIDMIDCA